jgi:hypothetical protein
VKTEPDGEAGDARAADGPRAGWAVRELDEREGREDGERERDAGREEEHEAAKPAVVLAPPDRLELERRHRGRPERQLFRSLRRVPVDQPARARALSAAAAPPGPAPLLARA